jgi:O-antigen ligase
MLFLLCVPGPTSVLEVSILPVTVCTLIRLPWIWRTLGGLWRQPLFWVLFVWWGWQTASLAWSADTGQGLDEAGNARWLLALVVLWPVIDGRRWLIAALVLGFACVYLAQIWQVTATHLGWWHWDRLPGRNSAWWDPAIGGSMLIAALGLHLPAAMCGRGRLRWVALAGCLATILALLATGTRGAWLASIGLIAISLAVMAWRVRPRRRLLRPMVGLVVGGVLTAAIAWPILGRDIVQRAETGWREVTGAIQNQRYETNTGMRILMARVAGESFTAHPIHGIGIGSFQIALRDRFEALVGRPMPEALMHDHTHNTLLHAAAVTGVVGAALTMTVAALGIWGGFAGPGRRGSSVASDDATGNDPVFPSQCPVPSAQCPNDPVARAPGFRDSSLLKTQDSRLKTSPLCSYDAGPAFALLGLICVSAFDTINVSTHTSALLHVLLALCLLARPVERLNGVGR